MNLTFCKPQTKIIEVMPASNPNKVCKRISEINNLNYKLIETKNVDENKKNLGDIDLSLNELKENLKYFI